MTESLSRTEDKPITAGQLRTWLEGLPDDTTIVMSEDGEGNGFSPLAEAEPNRVYVAESTWSGYLGRDEYEHVVEGASRVVVLWPTH